MEKKETALLNDVRATERERDDDSDVRQLYSTCLSVFIEVHLLRSLSSRRMGFIIYSGKVRASVNPELFKIESNQQKILTCRLKPF